MKKSSFYLATVLVLAAATTLAAQSPAVKDRAGHTYETVKIGSQVWMAENLTTEQFPCEGTAVSLANGSERGSSATFQDGQPHYAFYQNRPELEFGALYNQSAILQCEVCPGGYRIPTKEEWEALAKQLGGVDKAGAQLLRGGSSGFNADMVGRITRSGSVLEGEATSWWATGEDGSAAYTVELSADGTLTLYEAGNEQWGNYVRCVQEEPAIMLTPCITARRPGTLKTCLTESRGLKASCCRAVICTILEAKLHPAPPVALIQ